MSETATDRFNCEACSRSYAWKPELAGKRVKCKCGQVMTVPQSMASAPEQDDLYEMAPEPAPAKPKGAPRVPLAPRTSGGASAPAAAMAAAAPMPSKTQTLGYQSGPTEREKKRLSSDTLLDTKRDIYMPVVLLIIGYAVYLGYYAWRFELGSTGIAALGAGLAVMTLFKAALLVGFAFGAAGPLGVSFGGIGTAVLKLAAIAVFCDGTTTWVDYGVERISGMSGGVMGYGVLSFPVALGIYWVLLIQLFSMDSGDSWMVVMVLTVFDRFVKTIMFIIFLNMLLGWGGVAASSLPGVGSAPTALSQQVDTWKDRDQLIEAKQYIADGHQAAMSGYTAKWYEAGCTKVWFLVERDFDGRGYPGAIVLEMPKDKDKRTKVYQVLKDYYQTNHLFSDPDDFKDKGDKYFEARLVG